MSQPIYLDSQSTTPIELEVLEAMRPYQSERFGNPSSSTHRYGWEAASAVDLARQQVAALIEAHESEIVFTSGSTESNNLAIQGLFKAQGRGKHLITSMIEHPSVLKVAQALRSEDLGAHHVTILSTLPDGIVELCKIEKAVLPDTVLISIHAAHHELGVLQPIESIAQFCLQNRIYFHTDATQILRWLPLYVERWGVSLLTGSAHKIGGPKGTGFLYVRGQNPKVLLKPLFFGGSQENGLRPGTLNVAGIVGLGKAAEIAKRDQALNSKKTERIRDWILDELMRAIPGLQVVGHPVHRLPNQVFLRLPGMRFHELLSKMQHVALSPYAACLSGVDEMTVLEKLGVTDDRYSGFRIGLLPTITMSEASFAVEEIIRSVREWGHVESNP